MNIVSVLLSTLRRLARRMGETGGLLLMLFGFACAGAAISPEHGPAANVIGLTVYMTGMLCVFARYADGEGHRAMRRRREAQDTPAAQLAAWRASAGILGRWWGRLLPSDRLLTASTAAGERI
jgi:hypothetical protein